MAGVLLGRANVITSRLIISPAMFDLELKWTVGLGDGGKGERTGGEKWCPIKRSFGVIGRFYQILTELG